MNNFRGSIANEIARNEYEIEQLKKKLKEIERKAKKQEKKH